MIQRHRHTWLTWDAEKISYNDLKDKPEPSWWAPVIKTHTIPRLTSTGTYDIDFSDLWFTPNAVRIQAVMAFWTLCWTSDCISDWTTTSGVRWENQDVSWKTLQSETTRIIFTQAWDGTDYSLRANFEEFISNWVKIDITTNNSLADIECILTFYK